jgi:hypothetical protein
VASVTLATPSPGTLISARKSRFGVAPGRYWQILAARPVAFALPIIAILLAANALIGRAQLPNYATWTGIRPLEEKLALLQAASANGSPDALILGSSISDFGFNAEFFSSLVSERRGVDYRAFNFSTGATEIVTMPKLYRLARTVAKPRDLILIIPTEIKRPNLVPPRSPDYIMERAPIQPALRFPWLLPFAKAVWSQPLLRDSAAVRDQALFGRLANLPAQGSDLYAIDNFGDSLSFSFQVTDEQLGTVRRLLSALNPLTNDQEQTLPLEQRLQYYYNQLDIDAMAELRALAEADNVDITVVAHAVTATLYPEPYPDASYRLAQRQSISLAADALNARLIYDIDQFAVPRYALMDTVHLNHLGARMFTAQMAASFLDSPGLANRAPKFSEDATPSIHLPSDDVTINPFGALIETPGQSRKTLRLRYLANHAVPPMPGSGLFVAARRADGTDLVVPAEVSADGVVEATLDGLPTARQEIVLVRLLQEAGGRRVALNQPVAGYAWVDQR